MQSIVKKKYCTVWNWSLTSKNLLRILRLSKEISSQKKKKKVATVENVHAIKQTTKTQFDHKYFLF